MHGSHYFRNFARQKGMKTIILDFDGTIADTRTSIIETVRQTLQVLNLPTADVNEVREVIGLPLRDTFVKAAHIQDEALINKAMQTYRSLYNGVSLRTVRLFPHVADTLRVLHDTGVTLTVASSKGREALGMLLDVLGISPYISCVFGEQDVANKKPAPDMVLHILERTNTRAEDALVVGDTWFDIAMGRSAGCPTCGVSYGNHSVGQLREAGADFIIDDFTAILDIQKGGRG